MNWVRLHPYLSTIGVAVILVIAGVFVVQSHSPVSPTGESLTWEGGAAVNSYPETQTTASPQEIAQAVVQGDAPATISLPPYQAASVGTTSATTTATSDTFDYVALLAQMSGESSTSSTVSVSQSTSSNSNAAITQAYQYIPTGLIATNAPAKPTMTASQEALYEYGNDLGGEIQSFEELNMDDAQILKDQAEDRTNPAKNAAVVSLAEGFASVGTYMQQMQDVPTSAQSLHTALAQSYLDIGAKLQLVTQAQSDADFVQAIENYDTTANTFVHNYAALAQFFSEQGVTFSSQDPGSVFSFTDTSGGGGGL